MSDDAGSVSRARLVAAAIWLATVAQLLVAQLASGMPQFAGKAFGARLVAYPLLMALVPLVWWATTRRRAASGRTTAALPWAASAWLMLPFLVDVTGNTLDLYDGISWWDDVNHLVNWFFLGMGIGLVLRRVGVGPSWVLAALVTGLGAVLAIGWELGEYLTFIRHGTELAGAYTDTLGDEALGTTGAFLAALATVAHRRDEAPTP